MRFPVLLTAIVLPLLISACARELHDEMWTATAPAHVYGAKEDGEGSTDGVVFTLDSGESCLALREIVMKVYLHTELQCAKGRGWVTSEENFKILKVRR
jgi:hypothetical protein